MKGKEVLFIAISSFLLTIIWVVSNVYHAYATSTIDELLQVQIIPIPAEFDEATIARMKQREKIAPDFSAPTPTPASPTPGSEVPSIETTETTPVSPTTSVAPTQEISPSATP